MFVMVDYVSQNTVKKSKSMANMGRLSIFSSCFSKSVDIRCRSAVVLHMNQSYSATIRLAYVYTCVCGSVFVRV